MPETWQMSDCEIREVAGYVRWLGLAELTPLPGSAASGKAVYAKADCARCHAVNGQGGALGPDLTGGCDRRATLDTGSRRRGPRNVRMPYHTAAYRAGHPASFTRGARERLLPIL
jgi:hypothetical protein